MNVLIIVDMQNDFVDGALGTPEAVAIVPKVVEKIRNFDGLFAVTKDTHEKNYLETQEGKNLPVIHCVDMTTGWDLAAPVLSALNDSVTNRGAGFWTCLKPTFGSVELANWLVELNRKSKIDEITLVGLCTDICVISNALLIKAFLPETKITVDASCCAGVTPESHKNALDAMKMCQINIENEEVEP